MLQLPSRYNFSGEQIRGMEEILNARNFRNVNISGFRAAINKHQEFPVSEDRNVSESLN